MRSHQSLLPLAALAVLAARAVPPAHAETLYVIEQLVVSVSSTADATGDKVASIHSGDAVDVLERQGDQLHVRLANGTEGWIRKSYLSADPPLKQRLSDRTAEVEKLKQDVSRLQAELASAHAAANGKVTGSAGNPANSNTSTSTAPTAAPAPKASQQPDVTSATNAGSEPPTADAAAHDLAAADPSTHEPDYFMTPPDAPSRPVWHWALGSFVVALGLGFALGWQTLDRRIRRKYGGLRIY